MRADQKGNGFRHLVVPGPVDGPTTVRSLDAARRATFCSSASAPSIAATFRNDASSSTPDGAFSAGPSRAFFVGHGSHLTVLMVEGHLIMSSWHPSSHRAGPAPGRPP
jgi:hypothetical protein